MASPRMRNYGSMHEAKLVQCIMDLETGTGDACSPTRLAGFSRHNHLVSAKMALSRKYPKRYKKMYANKPFEKGYTSSKTPEPDPMEALRQRFEELMEA